MPTSEPHVPGAFGRYPAPPAVAKNSERRGFRRGSAGAASVFVFIGLRRFVRSCLVRRCLVRFGQRFVGGRLGHFVLLAGPVAKIGQAAAFAAKREIAVLGRIGWLPANGAMPFHGCRPRLTRRSWAL